MRITNNNFQSITIDTEGFAYGADVKIFIQNIKILNSIHQLSIINDICLKLKSPFKANTSIIYKLMDALLRNEHFSDSELTEYFTARNQLDLIEKKLNKIVDFDSIYIAYEPEFQILGFSWDKFFKLDERTQAELCEKYSEMHMNSIENFNCKEFISEAKKLISNYMG